MSKWEVLLCGCAWKGEFSTRTKCGGSCGDGEMTAVWNAFQTSRHRVRRAHIAIARMLIRGVSGVGCQLRRTPNYRMKSIGLVHWLLKVHVAVACISNRTVSPQRCQSLTYSRCVWRVLTVRCTRDTRSPFGRAHTIDDITRMCEKSVFESVHTFLCPKEPSHKFPTHDSSPRCIQTMANYTCMAIGNSSSVRAQVDEPPGATNAISTCICV